MSELKLPKKRDSESAGQRGTFDYVSLSDTLVGSSLCARCHVWCVLSLSLSLALSLALSLSLSLSLYIYMYTHAHIQAHPWGSELGAPAFLA